MIFKRNITLLILKVALLSSAFAQDLQFKPDSQVVLKKRNGKLLLHQCSRRSVTDVTSYWHINKEDLTILQNSFTKVLALDEYGHRIQDLNLFAYQYVGVVINKRKFIYINAFNKSYINHKIGKDWKKVGIQVCDGGPSFWGVLFDIDLASFKELSINGEG